MRSGRGAAIASVGRQVGSAVSGPADEIGSVADKLASAPQPLTVRRQRRRRAFPPTGEPVSGRFLTPPCERSSERFACVNKSNTVRSWSREIPTPVVAQRTESRMANPDRRAKNVDSAYLHRFAVPSSRSRVPRSLQCARRDRCTSRSCSADWQTPERAARVALQPATAGLLGNFISTGG